MRGTRLTAADLVGVVGILPTPSLPGADHWDARDTVDVEETLRMTRAVIDSGISALIVNGTFGEGATLTLSEVLEFNRAVLSVSRGCVPLFSGITTLNTRDTIERGRLLRDLGTDGLFVGRPMWLALDDDAIVEYYASVAEALPDLAICVYDNASAFKGALSTSVYAALARIPQVVAVKATGVSASPSFAANVAAVEGRVRVLPIADDWYASARLLPDKMLAAWSGDVASGPAAVVALADAVLARDWDTAERVDRDVRWASEPLFPAGDFEEFMRYSIQIDRAEFEAAGFIVPGPCRAPYTRAPTSHLEGGAESGRRWAELQTRYTSATLSTFPEA